MPILFLIPLKFTAVLPPIAASIIARNVVGISCSLQPRLNVDAAKATISVVTPPPMPTTTVFLVTMFLIKKAYIFSVSESVFLFSSALKR